MAEDHGIILPPPPRSLHVSSMQTARPVRRVVPAREPPRTVTYDGVEFEVMFDGVDHCVVEEPGA
jgi:hypothetical protein